jgi:hypothetical protein
MKAFKFGRCGSLVPAVLGVVLFLLTANQSPLAQQALRDAGQPDVRKSTTEKPAADCPESEPLRKNVQQLKGEVQLLKRRVADLEKDRLATTIQDQLEKEQQRGEALQLHLQGIAEKEDPLQARLDQINQQLRPESIERIMAGVGSLHPEDAREEVKKRLQTERIRIQSQLDLLRQDRIRTQSSLATTDAAILRLKQKLLEALRP